MMRHLVENRYQLYNVSMYFDFTNLNIALHAFLLFTPRKRNFRMLFFFSSSFDSFTDRRKGSDRLNQYTNVQLSAHIRIDCRRCENQINLFQRNERKITIKKNEQTNQRKY